MQKFVSDFLFGLAAGLGWLVIQALVALLRAAL